MTVQRSQMRELLISTGRKIAGGCDAAIAGVNASTARRLGVAAMIGVAASLAGCSKNENPLPQSRAGSGSYDSNSYRLPVDPATHLVLLEVSRDAQASVVNFAGGSGQGVGDGSTVSGAQSNQSKKFVIGGVVRQYATLGDTAETQKVAAVGDEITFEATDRKMTMLLSGHQVLMKCQGNLDVVSTTKKDEVLTQGMLPQRQILELDGCEMVTPNVNASQADFDAAIAATKAPTLDLTKHEGWFGAKFPVPQSRAGFPDYHSSSVSLPADTSTHVVYLKVGGAPKADTLTTSRVSTSGGTYGSGGTTYGSVSTYSSGGDKVTTIVVGEVLDYATVGGMPELVQQQAKKGDQIVMEISDRKAANLRDGDTIVLRCVADIGVLSAVKEHEVLTQEQLKQRRVGELDFCEIETPKLKATPADFRRAAGTEPRS